MAEFFRGMGARRNVGIGRGRGVSSFQSALSQRAPVFVCFVTSPSFNGNITISGQTLDSNNNPLANCVVELELSSDGSRVATTQSDGSGNYSFAVSNGPYQVNAYLSGSPDVSGITLNTLVGQ